MKLIVGLGNPGEKYKNNRHNAGFMFVDYLIKELTSSRINEFKIKDNSQFAKLVINNEELLLVKPLTFMNHSGRAVSEMFKNLKLKIENLIVIHDDLDIPLGKFKIQKGVGPKLHNGIESIERTLGAKPYSAEASRGRDFWRIRIGVDNRALTGWIDGETYSLQDFRPEEKRLIEETFPKIMERLLNQLQISNIKS